MKKEKSIQADIEQLKAIRPPSGNHRECRCPKCGDMHTKEIEVAQEEDK